MHLYLYTLNACRIISLQSSPHLAVSSWYLLFSGLPLLRVILYSTVLFINIVFIWCVAINCLSSICCRTTCTVVLFRVFWARVCCDDERRNIPKAPPATMPYRAANQARQLAMMLQKNLSTQERYGACIAHLHNLRQCLLFAHTHSLSLSLSVCLSLSLSLSLRFNGHFPGQPGLAAVYWSRGWCLMKITI